MLRVCSNRGAEPIGYIGYCDAIDDFAELTGVRTWILLTGGQVRFINGQFRCPNSEKCNSTGNCLLIMEAKREWAEEAKGMFENAKEQMLRWR